MPTTLKDIAAAAGVSIGTVERALKHRDRINPQVAEHIRALAKEMNYQPNKIASGLVNRTRNYKIAVVFHIMGNEFFDEVIRGIRRAEAEIRDYGVTVEMYFCRDFDAAMQLQQIEKAMEEGANGLVIVPINSPLIARKLRQLNKMDFPVVFFNSYLKRVSFLSSIHCDYYRSGRIGGMLVNRLSGGSGHAMAFLPSSALLGNNYRKDGITDYFKTVSPSLKLEKVVELSNSPEPDTEIMAEELRNHPEVEYLLYCGNADIALSAMEAVGRKFTSIFYDLSPETKKALLDGRIDATVIQSPRDMGYRSVETLFQFLTQKKEPQKEILMDSQILFKECID